MNSPYSFNEILIKYSLHAEMSLEEEQTKRFKDWGVQKVWSIETI